MSETMTAKSRAPRGTKVLTQAFFSAASDIPEAQRAAVIKAAMAAIRDELREGRAKAKVAKAKPAMKGRPGRKPGPRAKLGRPPMKAAAADMVPKRKVRGKPGRKPSMKLANASAG